MAAWSPLPCMITRQELNLDEPCTLYSAIVPTTPYGGQYFGHLMQRTDSLGKTLMPGMIEGRRRRGRENEMVGWHHQLNGHEFEQTPGDSKGQGSLACCNPWGYKDLDMTEQLNNTPYGCPVPRAGCYLSLFCTMVSALLFNFGGSIAVPTSAAWPSKSRDLLGLLKLGKIFLTMVKMKLKFAQLCLTLCKPMDCSQWNSPGQNTEVGRLSLLQGIFPTQGSNPDLLHCRQILYQLSHTMVCTTNQMCPR